MNSEVIHDKQQRRFELKATGGSAYVEYSDLGDNWTIHHTYVPPELRGQGVAATVVKAALDAARASGKKVIPTCAYVDSYIARHTEYSDLIGPRG